MVKKLRSGFTTGTHATAVLVGVFCEAYKDEIFDFVEVTLPKGTKAKIEIQKESKNYFSTIKGDNDDIDVTKGAKISCKLDSHMPQNLKEQTPTLLDIDKLKLYIWAGNGVGVVTKNGLKIKPHYPAINPTPLNMMRENIEALNLELNTKIHAVFEVKDGEKIAKNTANAKVGVLGGISILGTRGIVKPISASAYIDSIEVEIDVAAAQNEDILVLTLGNSAVDEAKESYNDISIVEIGNFVYDALTKMKKHRFKKLLFITSVAKMTKVAQGFKNTHNRYGTIDFDEIKCWIKDEFGVDFKEDEVVTLKGVLQILDDKYHKEFITNITNKALLRLQKWMIELDMKVDEIEVLTLPRKIKQGLRW